MGWRYTYHDEWQRRSMVHSEAAVCWEYKTPVSNPEARSAIRSPRCDQRRLPGTGHPAFGDGRASSLAQSDSPVLCAVTPHDRPRFVRGCGAHRLLGIHAVSRLLELRTAVNALSSARPTATLLLERSPHKLDTHRLTVDQLDLWKRLAEKADAVGSPPPHLNPTPRWSNHMCSRHPAASRHSPGPPLEGEPNKWIWSRWLEPSTSLRHKPQRQGGRRTGSVRLQHGPHWRFF